MPDTPAPEPHVSFSWDLHTSPIDDLITREGRELSNVPVARDRALTVPAVLRGRNMICSIATLPLVTKASDRTETRTPLLEQIDDAVPNIVTMSQTVEDLLLEGVAWWRVRSRLADGFPRSAEFVNAHRVSVNPPAGAPPRRLPSGLYPGESVLWVDGEPVRGRDMIRFDSPNPGILTAAARAIRRAIVFERASAMYARNPRPVEYFTPLEGADPTTDEEIEEILTAWGEARRAGSTAYVPASLKYNTVDMPSPAELQLVEMQKQATVEIANVMGLDSEDLQVSTTSRTYQSAVDRRRDRINDVLSPFMSAITDRLSMNDVTRRGQRVAFKLDDYMRADPTTRWGTYQTGLQNGVVSVAEVRAMEGLPDIPVEPRPVAPVRRPGVRRQVEEPRMSHTSGAQFADDTDDGLERIAFDGPPVDAEFRVDRERRTVEGLLVPWGKVARSAGAAYTFARGSLSWSEVSRVKLNREHARFDVVGVARRLEVTDEGLVGTFKIARGEDGDRVLSLAEDGILDGFSIEAEFDEGGVEWSRTGDDGGVRRVSRARLAGVAITSSPAFDDARVSGVAASRKDTHVYKPDEGQNEAPAPGPDAAAFTSAVEAMAGAVERLGQVQAELPQKIADEVANTAGPAFVDPAGREQQKFSVNEEPLYRFDGIGGQHDFSSDMIAGAKGDDEARARVEEWIGANFSVETGDVESLNPARQRPDMYVDQLDYVTPIWDSINKGSISDNTPFVLPKFESSANLVNEHTEGTEPDSGTFTTTSQTITPQAVSGKVEITRETWDQGGNPQLSSILWRQIVRAYREGLENSAASMLADLSVATIALTGSDVELTDELKQALAALQFVRGGNRFRDFKLHGELYNALAGAKDGNGRPMFPVLSPSNADGTADAFFGSIAVGGLAGVPAWALNDAGGGSSFLYNREDVHGWASAPNRLEFQYRVAYVDVGVWGYKAVACTREDGVREITYAPSDNGGDNGGDGGGA
ncbi:phage portal protein [Saccharomonospora sp. CUA-673]|uniref:phage portal protein n=1 Tax=Saccharomonospora sp. CUA-673 TaxID=1904969 RepID=UPI000B10871F|nr:phage portal protein [Saccharomonospora sp. CUA-673]